MAHNPIKFEPQTVIVNDDRFNLNLTVKLEPESYWYQKDPDPQEIADEVVTRYLDSIINAIIRDESHIFFYSNEINFAIDINSFEFFEKGNPLKTKHEEFLLQRQLEKEPIKDAKPEDQEKIDTLKGDSKPTKPRTKR